MEDSISGRYEMLIDEIPSDVGVLVSHQPPFGLLDITDYCNGPRNHGSKKLKDIVVSYRPKAHLFGHEHSSNGLVIENGIIYSNASLLDDSYKQTYNPRLIEI